MARYTYKKTYEWNSNIAYLVGLMASDGCLINDGRHLNITSKDIEIINTFKSILHISTKHSVKLGGFNASAFHFQFGDVSFYDFLMTVGLTPAKSLTLGELAIPDEFFRDYLRGHFDGDGTVYGYIDKRWKNSRMFYFGIASASIIFLDWLQANNSRLIGVTNGAIKQGGSASTLYYAKRDSKLIFDFIYGHNPEYRLSRKYYKFIAFLKADKYANKE